MPTSHVCIALRAAEPPRMGERIRVFLEDLGLWLWTLLRNWSAAVTGGVAVAILAIFQLKFQGDHGWEPFLTRAAWIWVAGGAVLSAAFQAWRSERTANRRPDLVPIILGAFDTAQNSNDLLITLRVLIENHSEQSIMISRYETRMLHADDTFTSEGFDPPDRFTGFVLRGNRYYPVTPASLLANIGAVPGRGKIECIAINMYRNVADLDFAEVTLQFRVQGIGSEWSPWTGFQPPRP